MKMTSAYANKLLKKLQEDKEYLLSAEREGFVYVAALDEEPVIPAYSYEETAASLEKIDETVIKIKHAINVSNATSEVAVGEVKMTVDEILVRMAQLSRRKETLDMMRKQQPKTRIGSGSFGAKKTEPEYQYVNYDLELIRKEYDRVDALISAMQLALDKHNQTFEFDVDVE